MSEETDRPSSDRLMQQWKEVEASRFHEQTLVKELEKAEQEWQRRQKVYRKSRTLYENAVDPFRSPSDPVGAGRDIATLRELHITDRSDAESHATHVRRVQQELQAAQQYRSRNETNFILTARLWVQTPGFQTAITRLDQPPDWKDGQPGRPKSAASSVSDLDHLVRRFNQKSSDVSVLGERLAEHNFEYWNEVARRELRRDHEETLSLPDEDFETNAQLEKESISQELSRAIKEADGIKAQWLSATEALNGGKQMALDPAFTANVDTAQSTLSALVNEEGGPRAGYQDSLQAALSQIPHTVFEEAEVIRAEGSDAGSDDKPQERTHARVSNWMEQVRSSEAQPGYV
ncbi:hypothetical protein WHR41_07820 [Cladosporium halotolerans]|uniref:Uncharacterized protein n=1 Tax=Cladosporium halotolerans TaxID=1052096 RepID=A0AB34KK06_9PEZI